MLWGFPSLVLGLHGLTFRSWSKTKSTVLWNGISVEGTQNLLSDHWGVKFWLFHKDAGFSLKDQTCLPPQVFVVSCFPHVFVFTWMSFLFLFCFFYWLMGKCKIYQAFVQIGYLVMQSLPFHKRSPLNIFHISSTRCDHVIGFCRILHSLSRHSPFCFCL